MKTSRNIWQIGLVMHLLIDRPEYRVNWSEFTTYIGTSSGRLRRGGLTIGKKIDIENDRGTIPNQSNMSKALRIIIAECLLLEPSARPSARELCQMTVVGLEAINKMGSKQTDGYTVMTDNEPAMIEEEPLLSARWYSGQADSPVRPPLATAEEDERLAFERLGIAMAHEDQQDKKNTSDQVRDGFLQRNTQRPTGPPVIRKWLPPPPDPAVKQRQADTRLRALVPRVLAVAGLDPQLQLEFGLGNGALPPGPKDDQNFTFDLDDHVLFMLMATQIHWTAQNTMPLYARIRRERG